MGTLYTVWRRLGKAEKLPVSSGQGQFMKGAGTASSPLPGSPWEEEAGTKPSPPLALRLHELAVASGVCPHAGTTSTRGGETKLAEKLLAIFPGEAKGANIGNAKTGDNR